MLSVVGRWVCYSIYCNLTSRGTSGIKMYSNLRSFSTSFLPRYGHIKTKWTQSIPVRLYHVSKFRTVNAPNRLLEWQKVTNTFCISQRGLSWSSLWGKSPSAETSVNVTQAPQQIDQYIPEPPPVPEASTVQETIVNTGVETPFSEIGLGGWGPVGIVQNIMEWLHITNGIPWWGCIVIGTITVRLLLFPLVIMAQRNSAKMANNLPQLQLLQLKMTQARQSGNALEAARLGHEMMNFMKEKELSPMKNLLVPVCQAPIFISFFLGLRGMANTPVESLKTGGLFWFEDLTVSDPYYLLPLLTSATMWLTIELGTDSARLSAQNAQMMRYVLRALPVFVFPFVINFPGAILCYWVSTNLISLIQVGFLRIPSVRQYFNIEQVRTITPDSLPVKDKGFKEGLKDAWTNIKITRELEDRQRLNELNFRKAGTGPIQKTYKYDPTRQNAQGVLQRGFKEIKK